MKCLVMRSVHLLPGLRIWAVRYIVRIAVGLCFEVPLCQPHNCNQACSDEKTEELLQELGHCTHL